MQNLFEQFQGADLDRLTDCIQAVKAAGLKIDKYTQAGVNQNSGNVWIYGECWAGCVCCSIGFDVSWYYSCPECGEEHEFDTYAEMESYASDNENEHCGACHEETETEGEA
jgi:hypothetical protein